MEPDLLMTYDDIRVRVGRERGYGTDMSLWSAEQNREVELAIKDGVARVYLQSGYEWSFLKPKADITIPEGVTEVDMPVEFAYHTGDVFFAEDESIWGSICVESDKRIFQWRESGVSLSGAPSHIAFIPKGQPGQTRGHRMVMLVYPTPDRDYRITMRYSVLGEALSPSRPYPWGGAAISQTVMLACLAASEQANGVIGVHTGLFAESLRAAIIYDTKLKPALLRERSREPGLFRDRMSITYTPGLT